MAKDKKYSGPGKDLGTVKEVHCSGVSVTTTGAKVFIANVAKGDRIIEVDGKKQIAPKAVSSSSTSTSNKNEDKGNTQSTTSSNSNSNLEEEKEDEDKELNQGE